MTSVHKPFFLEHPEKKAIVVFVHGFMGSPRQFDRLAKSAYALGYCAASLLLPGHGFTAKEFSASRMEQWQGHVYEETERLTHSYKRIYIAGHSMGSLMAINAATKYKEHVCGLFLIACPFKLKYLSMHSMRVRMMQVFYRKKHPVKSAYLEGCSVPLRPNLLWRTIKPVAQVKKLMLLTKGNLHNVKVPVTAAYSSYDEIVSIDSLETLKNGLTQAALNTITLSDSLHAYYPEHEQAALENALTSLLQKEFD